MTLIFGVAPPVARHQVQPAVSVEIAGGDAVPPALVLAESELLGGFAELSLSEAKDSDRAAVAGERQFRQPIAVQVGPDRPADQANFCQRQAGLRVQPKRSAVITEEKRRSRFRVPTRNDASADK